jgi:hypothetical protein
MFGGRKSWTPELYGCQVHTNQTYIMYSQSSDLCWIPFMMRPLMQAM